MLRWRLLLGTLLIAVLVGLCWLDHRAAVPGVWLAPVLVVLAVLATGEILDLAAAAGMHPVRWPVYVGNLLVLASPWMPRADGDWPLWAFGLGVLLVFAAEMYRYEKPGGVTANIAAAVFAIAYVGVLLSFAVQVRLTWGIGALAAMIIAVKMADTGAYTVGRLIGKHKMAPTLSPGKTIEGLIGGLGFAAAGSFAAFHWLVPLAVPPTVQQALPDRPWGWLVFGLLVGGAGTAGDLAESLLKRDTARKDSSTWMPGFGGVLDILDSVLLAGPVAYFCWVVGLVGG